MIKSINTKVFQSENKLKKDAKNKWNLRWLFENQRFVQKITYRRRLINEFITGEKKKLWNERIKKSKHECARTQSKVKNHPHNQNRENRIYGFSKRVKHLRILSNDTKFFQLNSSKAPISIRFSRYQGPDHIYSIGSLLSLVSVC